MPTSNLTIDPHHNHCEGKETKTTGMAPVRGNVTGFNARKLAAAAGAPARDPWARAEQWRYTGPFTRWNRFKGSFPGLGIATVAFAAYCGYEYLFIKDDHHAHAESGHGEGQH